MTNPLQKHEWLLRFALTQLRLGLTYLERIPDPQPVDESGLYGARVAMCDAMECIQKWVQENGVVMKESMGT